MLDRNDGGTRGIDVLTYWIVETRGACNCRLPGDVHIELSSKLRATERLTYENDKGRVVQRLIRRPPHHQPEQGLCSVSTYASPGPRGRRASRSWSWV